MYIIYILILTFTNKTALGEITFVTRFYRRKIKFIHMPTYIRAVAVVMADRVLARIEVRRCIIAGPILGYLVARAIFNCEVYLTTWQTFCIDMTRM